MILIIAVTVLTLVGLLSAIMQWATINNLNVIQGIQSSEIWFEGDSYDRESISSLVKAEDYDFIYYDQIKWYEWLVEGVRSEIGSTVPSLLFFHIPLPEFENVFNAVNDENSNTGTVFGENREGIYSPPVNTGLFERAIALKSTTHIFCGHDHVNSLSAVWRGIRLTYGLKSGPNSYSDDDMRGATLITIEDDTNKVVVQHIYK